MPRIDFNSQVMHSGTSSKDPSDEIVGSQSALILDDSHAFDVSYNMLYSYSERVDCLVVLFSFRSKRSPSRLFHRLENNRPLRFISLIPAILIQQAGIRKSIHGIGYFFIMRLSTNALTNKTNQAAACNKHCIFDRAFLFLSSVILFLFIWINRTGNLALCPVMQQNRKRIFAIPRLEQSIQSLLSSCRHCSRIRYRQRINRLQCF